MTDISGGLRRLAGAVLLRTRAGRRRALRGMFGVDGPHGHPTNRAACGVLRTQAEVDAALAEVQRLGLPPHGTTAKNWDSLVALDQILRHTTPSARVFDAGGEYYSRLLPWLALYGYGRLTAGNLAFNAPGSRGGITYAPMDLTRTPFRDAAVDAATCLSVLEHGVDIDAAFREFSRILAPGGRLVVSTDYWSTPVATGDAVVDGVPVRILTRADIEAWLETAARHGLDLAEPLDWTTGDPVVHWTRFDLRFTFIVFTLRKRGRVVAGSGA